MRVYVDETKFLRMFPLGTLDSALLFKSIAEDPTNNITQILTHTEKDQTEMRNIIILMGPDVDDGWTELNASDFSGGGGSVEDYTGTDPTTPRAGVAAIKVVNEPGNLPNCSLSFPKYWLPYLDFSKMSSKNISFQLFHYSSVGLQLLNRTIFALRDTDYNEIQYVWDESYWSYDPDNPNDPTKWLNKTVPVGYGTMIWDDDNKVNAWKYGSHSGTLTFNWKINRLSWTSGYRDYPLVACEWFLLDGLKIPQQMFAVNNQAGSAKTKHFLINKPDIMTQIELQAFADQLAPKRKVVLERLAFNTLGSAGYKNDAWHWLPGAYATVNIPDEKINNGIYRFVSLHHILEQELSTEWDHIVEVEMVPKTMLLDTQQWSYGTQGSISVARRMRDELRALETRGDAPQIS